MVETVVSGDEEFHNVKFDKIPTLKPVFKSDGACAVGFSKLQGTITAANASTLNDGASAVVLVEAEEATKRNLKPLAVILGEIIFVLLISLPSTRFAECLTLND